MDFLLKCSAFEMLDAQRRYDLCEAPLDNTAIAKRLAITQQRQ
jgi:hypothetical protein